MFTMTSILKILNDQVAGSYMAYRDYSWLSWSYNLIVEVLVFAIYVKYVHWFKGRVKTHDVIIVIFGHALYVIPLCLGINVILSQICNPTVLGDWCKHESLVIGKVIFSWVIKSSNSLKIFSICSGGAWSICSFHI